MKKILKYKIPHGRLVEIETTAYAPIVHVGEQEGVVCIWVEVNDKIEVAQRSFAVFGTGHEIPEEFIHIGTVQEGTRVSHVYERYPKVTG